MEAIAQSSTEQGKQKGMRPWEILVAVLVVLGLTWAMTVYASNLIERTRSGNWLTGQVAELAGRGHAVSFTNIGLVAADALPSSPTAIKVALHMGLGRLPAESVRRLLARTQSLPLAGFRHHSGTDPTAILPEGVRWEGERLVNKWGGDVAVFMRPAGITMVAYSKVPAAACEGLTLGQFSTYRDFLFVCNDELVVAEVGGGSGPVDVDQFLSYQTKHPKVGT